MFYIAEVVGTILSTFTLYKKLDSKCVTICALVLVCLLSLFIHFEAKFDLIALKYQNLVYFIFFLARLSNGF